MNLASIPIPNNKSKCRLCFDNPNETFDIFSEEGARLKVDSILVKHFAFLQIHNDGTNAQICKFCWRVVHDFHNLYEKTEQLCGQWSAAAVSTNIQCEPDFDTVKIEFVHGPYVKLELLDGNKESSDKIHLVVDEDSDAIATNDIGGGDAAANDSTSSSSSSYLQKKRKQKVAKSVRKHQLPLSKKPRKNKKQEPSEIEVAEKELRRKKDDAMNETILEHFCLDCKECSHSSKTFMNFMTHSMQVHKKRGFVYCCDRKFSKRCKVLEHISLHTDPESFKCNECNKSFATKFSHQNHMERHVPVEQRLFKCNKCPQTFSKLYILDQHLRWGHLDGLQNYSCDICDKRFTTKHSIKMHIINTHVGSPQSSHICYICAKIYKSKASLKFHIMENHNQDPDRPKLQCNICGACFTNELYLKRHAQRHSESLVKCPLCDKSAPSKLALRSHMRYMHSERSHKCNICGKSFARPIGLKEHMASHTGQDLYNCHYCTKTFKSNANMHSHRKKVHPIEWSADRLKRINRS